MRGSCAVPVSSHPCRSLAFSASSGCWHSPAAAEGQSAQRTPAQHSTTGGSVWHCQAAFCLFNWCTPGNRIPSVNFSRRKTGLLLHVTVTRRIPRQKPEACALLGQPAMATQPVHPPNPHPHVLDCTNSARTETGGPLVQLQLLHLPHVFPNALTTPLLHMFDSTAALPHVPPGPHLKAVQHKVALLVAVLVAHLGLRGKGVKCHQLSTTLQSHTTHKRLG